MSDRQSELGFSAIATTVDVEALRSDVRSAIINQKANACPMMVRLAWHASGTYSKVDRTGGSNGATMRFAPESEDGANAGLGIARDILLPVAKAHPEISQADLWTFAGCCAIEMMGGPRIPFNFGRSDAPNGKCCPVVGRLPDASLGAQHLRDVFYRMGFEDRDIVALSGAHTLGSCHETRSGFDGPWTRTPLQFNNSYFSLLLNLDWKPRIVQSSGNKQFEAKSGDMTLMMLPTDMVLREDVKFRKFVELYAADQDLFFKDFASAFGRLIALGCPDTAQPTYKPVVVKGGVLDSGKFRQFAMHGSVEPARALKAAGVDVHAVESSSGRTALHKSAFWGHTAMSAFLINECKIDVNVKDSMGDTACHDAARFGHMPVVEMLLKAGANPSIKNKAGKTAGDVAREYDKTTVASVLVAKL